MESKPNALMSYVRDFNPWPRIRLMGTNLAQDTMAGVTVAFIALPLALGFGVASGLRKAANQGYSEAQHSLALSYSQGLGVPKDEIQAYMWWTLASLAGHQIADGFRKSIARNMTAFQISEAEKLAQKWLEDFNQKRKLGSY